MTDSDVTHLVVALCLVFGLVAFGTLIAAPAVSAFRTGWERGAALVLSLYVLAAFVAIGVVLGVIIVAEWPRIF